MHQHNGHRPMDSLTMYMTPGLASKTSGDAAEFNNIIVWDILHIA